MKKRLLLAMVVLTGMFLLSASIVSAQSRFTDNGDGTVTDTETQLIWSKNANLANGSMPWDNATDYANNLGLGDAGCGASHTDWRLPHIKELQSLIDFGNYDPALPTDHPFTNVQSADNYWSSTTLVYNAINAWYVGMINGRVLSTNKINSLYVWPVRSGN